MAGDMPVYMETEHCIKEEVPAEACCQAKRDGKDGVGLEDACTTLTITPGSDAAPEAPQEPAEEAPQEPAEETPQEPAEETPQEPAEEAPQEPAEETMMEADEPMAEDMMDEPAAEDMMDEPAAEGE